MALVYHADLRTARLGLVRDRIDGLAGSPSGPGRLQIGDFAFSNLLVEVELTEPCGIVTGDVLTFTMPQDGIPSATGAAAVARLVDFNGDVIVSGLTVGTSGTHVLLNTTAIVIGEIVTISAASITHG